MARDIKVIKQQILDTKDSLPALVNLTSDSQVAVYQNMFHTLAAEIGILEQLIDSYQADFEDTINNQGVGNAPWLRGKILEFQLGEYVQLDTTTFAISYPEENEAAKIITRCSVRETGNLIVDAKVAKSDPPVALSGAEVTALDGYLKIIKPPGTQINIVSLDSDKLYLEGTIYYSGQYSTEIQTNVEAALTAYMAGLSSVENFDGTLRVLDIVDAIKAVTGVKDVNITEVGARAHLTAFSGRTVIYKLSTGVNVREYTTTAGYIVEETTTGSMFTDKLVYTAI